MVADGLVLAGFVRGDESSRQKAVRVTCVVWVSAASAIREVVLHNLAGQQVGRQAVNGLGVAEVRLVDMTAGLYLMEVVLENGTRATRRVVRK